MSGVVVNDVCVKEWNNMKLKHKYSYLTFKIINDKEIVCDQMGAKDAPYSSFQTALPVDECRYGVVEVPGTTKIVFVLWAPESANVKGKMTYAASRQALLDRLSGCGKTVQASCLGDIEEGKVKACTVI